MPIKGMHIGKIRSDLRSNVVLACARFVHPQSISVTTQLSSTFYYSNELEQQITLDCVPYFSGTVRLCGSVWPMAYGAPKGGTRALRGSA
eukprot:4394364-Prymnesium_polylepis.1